MARRNACTCEAFDRFGNDALRDDLGELALLFGRAREHEQLGKAAQRMPAGAYLGVS